MFFVILQPNSMKTWPRSADTTHSGSMAVLGSMSGDVGCGYSVHIFLLFFKCEQGSFAHKRATPLQFSTGLIQSSSRECLSKISFSFAWQPRNHCWLPDGHHFNPVYIFQWWCCHHSKTPMCWQFNSFTLLSDCPQSKLPPLLPCTHDTAKWMTNGVPCQLQTFFFTSTSMSHRKHHWEWHLQCTWC